MVRFMWQKWYRTEPREVYVRSGHVGFDGFEITLDNVRPCKKFLRAILEFPQPRNFTEIRS